MAYNGPVIGVDLDAVVAGTGTSSDQGNQFVVGQTVTSDEGRVYMYVHASAAVSLYDVVGIGEDFEAAPLTKAMADDGWMVGVANEVALSDNDFGWVCIKGSDVEVNVLASCAADVALYTTGTAGKLDDNSTSQTKIDGIVSTEANGTSTSNVTCILTWPKSTTF